MSGYVSVKHAERCRHCEKRYINIRSHEAKCNQRKIGNEPFCDERLTPQQNKACEMLFNGFNRDEIMDEMDIEDRQLRRLFFDARQRGVAVPRDPGGNTHKDAWPIDKLLELRDQLASEGITWGANPIIAERLGMTANAVKVRLWKHAHKEGQAA